MKSILIAGVAAFGLSMASSPTTAEAGCYRGGGYAPSYGFAPSYGYGGGLNYGYTRSYRAPVQSYVPVQRHRNHYHPVAGPVYPRGYHGVRSSRNFYRGNRGGVTLSFGF